MDVTQVLVESSEYVHILEYLHISPRPWKEMVKVFPFIFLVTTGSVLQIHGVLD